MFSFVNTIPEQGAHDLKNVQWDVLRECTTEYDKVIALGGFVSAVLKKLDVHHFKMPHPSPRNRLLNDKEYERTQVELCREYLAS